MSENFGEKMNLPLAPSESSGSGRAYLTKEDYITSRYSLKKEYKENSLAIRNLRNDIATLGVTPEALKERSEKQSKIAHLSARQRELIDLMLFLRLRAKMCRLRDILNMLEREFDL